MKKTLKFLILTAIIALTSACKKGDEPTPTQVKQPLTIGYDLYTVDGSTQTLIDSQWETIAYDSATRVLDLVDSINHPYMVSFSQMIQDTVTSLNKNLAKFDLFLEYKNNVKYTDTANCKLIYQDLKYITETFSYNPDYSNQQYIRKHYYSNIIVSYTDKRDGKQYLYKIKYIVKYFTARWI